MKLSQISLWWKRWFLSSNAKDIRILCIIFALSSGLLGTAFSVLIRLELLGPGVQYIADNQLYNSIITAHAIIMILFMVIPGFIGILGVTSIGTFISKFKLLMYLFNYNNKPHPFSTQSLLQNCSHGLALGLCSICIVCIHNNIGSECSACLSLGEHLHTIGQCTHSWVQLSYDEFLVGVCCDFSDVNNPHELTRTLRETVYHCIRCNAVCCETCYVD